MNISIVLLSLCCCSSLLLFFLKWPSFQRRTIYVLIILKMIHYSEIQHSTAKCSSSSASDHYIDVNVHDQFSVKMRSL